MVSCIFMCFFPPFYSLDTEVSWILSFSCTAVTVTARLCQRNPLLSGTLWKDEHWDINRYSLLFSLKFVSRVLKSQFLMYLCVSSSHTAPPWLSSPPVPPWTWSWISRPAGHVRGNWWRSWALWGSSSCGWRSHKPGRAPNSPTGPWETSDFAACSERPRDRWVCRQFTRRVPPACSTNAPVLPADRLAKASRSNGRRRRQRGGWGRPRRRFCRWGGRARKSLCRCKRSGWVFAVIDQCEGKTSVIMKSESSDVARAACIQEIMAPTHTPCHWYNDRVRDILL